MPLLELSPSDQYLIASGDTPLLEVWEALPLGLFPPFPPVELPGGLNSLLQRGGFGQTFFFGAEVLGLTLKTPQGRTVQAGGRVVKNVQGYDLVRPFVGSFGALGEAISVTLRLRPGRASVFLRRPLEAPSGWPPVLDVQPRFLWQHQSTLFAFHFGHPKEVERFRQAFGGEVMDSPVDYSRLFPHGMGVGVGPLRDLRFSWADGGAKPPLPPVFQKLASAL
ncbi:DUF5639 domain-containing protein [Allomeiothermus silvanus]|uniref:DUF5639 domain-containing protein n=1 Tax=Allomeiothermus silvanus TaxID=52022 RepID=UPI0023F024F1|nr:DUF5639 domain-containing protein [Allomeiothermus silvanus]